MDPPGLVAGKILLLTNLPYRPLKLFRLSLLWRMSVSSLREFALVKLGPHEERIRQMLLQDDPGQSRLTAVPSKSSRMGWGVFP